LSAEKDSAGPSGNRRCRPPPRTRCADPSPRRISDSEQSALGLISVLKHAAVARVNERMPWGLSATAGQTSCSFRAQKRP
jgi:hypothetical protein